MLWAASLSAHYRLCGCGGGRGCTGSPESACLGRRRGPGLRKDCQGHSPPSSPPPASYCSKMSFYFLSFVCACVCAKLLQLCLTLCDPMDSSPPGSSVHGILQARILEWVAMPSSRGSSRPRDRTCVSYISCIGRRVFFCFVLFCFLTTSTTWEA